MPTAEPISKPMGETTRRSNLGTEDSQGAPQQVETRRIALKSWVWVTGVAIVAAVAYRIASDPIALSCPGATADTLNEGEIYVCQFGYPKLAIDNLFFGCLYIWTVTSLLATLAGMRWRAAGMVAIMTIFLLAADISSETIAWYLV